MQRIASMAAVLLLVATAAWPAEAAMMLSATPSVHPASCHGDEPASPPAAPVNFQCCAGGHHDAIPSVGFVPRPSLARVAVVNGFEKAQALSDAFRYSDHSVVPSYSPQGSTPLRI